MLYAIPNLTSSTAFTVKPWEYQVDIPAKALKSKADYTAWTQAPTTKNCHFSAFEGLDPMRRVSADNPAVQLHGLVADYDAKCTREMILEIITGSPTEFVPNWGSNTFSGNGRLVWLFEQPVNLPSQELTVAFLKLVSRKLKLTKFLPGFDECFFDPSQYYDKGRDWIPLSGDPVPVNVVWQWAYEAGGKVKWKDSKGIHVPLDIVAAEVQRKFPGKWKGPFEDGARGSRFWDDMATNLTAAVVRPTGMQCFSGDEAFLPWSELLGSSFVDRYRANTTGQIIKDFYFDSRAYWKQDEDGGWRAMTKDDLKLMLKVKYSLSATTGKKDASSEVEQITYAIQESKRIEGAAPFIHRPAGQMIYNHGKHLNIASRKCMEPIDKAVTEWGDGFPWVAQFLEGFFEPAEQLDFFLAWLHHFYRNGYIQKPRAGHALFIAGTTNVGKTFLSTGIISRMVGGHMDASDFLMGDTDFTSHVVQSPIMSVDDTQGASDSRKHTAYSSGIKKVVANRHMMYHQKYGTPTLVEWMGRIIVTLNIDPESVKLLPNCDISIMDKIMMLRCAQVAREFPGPVELETILSTELPYFCRWILDYKMPDHCKGDVRFGVQPYHDKHLYNEAIQSSDSYAFFELLVDFLAQLPKDQEYYEGTSTQLMADMSLDERIGGLAARYSPALAAKLMGQLKARGFEFERVRNSTQRKWRIPLNIGERQEGVKDGKG